MLKWCLEHSRFIFGFFDFYSCLIGCYQFFGWFYGGFYCSKQAFCKNPKKVISWFASAIKFFSIFYLYTNVNNLDSYLCTIFGCLNTSRDFTFDIHNILPVNFFSQLSQTYAFVLISWNFLFYLNAFFISLYLSCLILVRS